MIILLFVFFSILCSTSSLLYKPCKKKEGPELRDLYVATCDTRSGWKEFTALKSWNVTGHPLRSLEGLSMRNVCTGRNWGANGFLTKPLLYLEFLKSLPKKNARGGLVYVILMDSDTFWSTNSVQEIWRKFDCARGTKDMVLSTEMSCWVGRYCTESDLKRWYNNKTIEASPSYSPFANSGVVMGLATKVARMLEYVVANNQSYFITYHKHKFDDQYAIADYAINVRPEDVALDYNQQLLASFSIHCDGDPHEDGWPFVCKKTDGTLSNSCPNWTVLLQRLGHFYVNTETCHVERKYWPNMPISEQLHTLAPDPVIWHGNGVGKRSFYTFGHGAFKCFLDKRNMTEDNYMQTFG